MSSSLRKIALLILVVILLPVLVFSVFEIGNLRQNEKVIQDIYRNQLDAILYSINQYSDDIVSNLASRIESNSNNYKSDSINEPDRIISENPSVINLIRLDNNLEFISSVPYSYGDSAYLPEIITMLNRNSRTLQQLQTYIRGGYRKIETIGTTSTGMQLIVFYTLVKDLQVINILVIDPAKFISMVLDPKIQEIAKDKFYIVAFRAGEDLPFYTSGKQYDPGQISNKESFWLLKNYQMGIELKDITIADLARERTKRNLIVIGLMDVILFFGTWLIFRNIKRQVELSQLKSDFVSSVSHEIRTPLALISMYIETLDMGRVKDAKKVKEYYSVILNETTRLSGIVNRILNFSQIDSNKRKYFFSDTDINEIIENAALTFRYAIDNKGFTYTFNPDKNIPLIMADREAVADAFVNLIDNAMKYSSDTKEIVVRTGKYDNYVYVEVEDRGIGISEKNQKYIFDNFYRVTEVNLANRVKGSGLGLAIVKHIVESHKGKIDVKSSLGSGSIFRLSFPFK
jgi:two-component system, OmpR family, phosphate regulon sensor histidine kinase PhoR